MTRGLWSDHYHYHVEIGTSSVQAQRRARSTIWKVAPPYCKLFDKMIIVLLLVQTTTPDANAQFSCSSYHASIHFISHVLDPNIVRLYWTLVKPSSMSSFVKASPPRTFNSPASLHGMSKTSKRTSMICTSFGCTTLGFVRADSRSR